MNEVLLEVEGLTVDIATSGGTLHAVRGVSFGVRRGETLCLVGEFGCGKSMTALAIMDLLPTTATRNARRLRFEGRDLLGGAMANLRGDRVAMIFQEPMTALNPAYTIGDQLDGGVICVTRAALAAAARTRAVLASREGRHCIGRRALAAIPASAFGRAPPARDDRDGARCAIPTSSSPTSLRRRST